MLVPGYRDVLVRWNPFRGWWLDDGFGVNPNHRYYLTRAEAIRTGHDLVRQVGGRVFVQHGAGWEPARTPVLVEMSADLEEFAPVRVRRPTPR